VRCNLESDDKRREFMGEARAVLERLIALGSVTPRGDGVAPGTGVPNQVVLTREHDSARSGQSALVEFAVLFSDHFEPLLRVLSSLASQLHLARLLGKPRAVFLRDYLHELRSKRVLSAP